jgi:hypothetical protein
MINLHSNNVFVRISQNGQRQALSRQLISCKGAVDQQRAIKVIKLLSVNKPAI